MDQAHSPAVEVDAGEGSVGSEQANQQAATTNEAGEQQR